MTAWKVNFTCKVRLFANFFILCSFLSSAITENDFFVSEEIIGARGTNRHWKCFTNSSYAISWITPLTDENDKNNNYVSEFPPNEYAKDQNKHFPCSFGNDETCNPYWTIDGSHWFIENSLKTNGPTLPIDHLLLDRRWEGIKEIFTTAPTGSSGEVFYELAAETNMKDFRIPISVRTEEGHILLCDDYDLNKSKCYWFILEGWMKTRSVLRTCEGKIPKQNNIFSCKNRKDLMVVEHGADLPPIMSKDVWSHFEIVKTNNKISVMQMESPGKFSPKIEYTENEKFIDVKYVILTSKTSNGLWKVHSYDYLYTIESNERYLGPEIKVVNGNLCIAMYVAMCTSCSMTLFLSNSDRSITYEKQTYLWKSSGWREIRYIVTNMTSTTVVLYAITTRTDRTHEQPFWAIANVRFCQKNEFRFISLDFAQSKGTVPPICQLMSDSNNLLQSLAKTELIGSDCPENTLGAFCVPCKYLKEHYCFSTNTPKYTFGVKLCSRNIYHTTICSCSAGFEGNSCEFGCEKGTYGHGCQHQCGYCKNESSCSHVDGYCEPCLEPFFGATCKEVPGIIFEKPPTLKNMTYSSCIIEVSDFTVLGKNTEQPDSYVIHYKPAEYLEQNDWQAFGGMHKIDNDKTSEIIEITNLEKETEYFIRTIALGKDGSSYNGPHVKYTKCKTKCKDLSVSDIQISHESTSANVILMMNQLTCKSKSYNVEIVQGRGARNKKPNSSGINDFQFENLQPYTNYTVKLTASTGEVITQMFTTDEDAPDPVEWIKSHNATATSLTIKWKEPFKKNGIIRYYSIKYKKQNHLSCEASPLESDWSKAIEILNMSVLIQDLEPYSSYAVVVSAYTIKEGIEKTGYFETASIDEISQNEVPVISEIVPGDSKITILLNQPNCNILRGSIELRFNTTCNSEWCSLEDSKLQTVLNYINDNEIILKELYPFTNYSLKLKTCRTNGPCSDTIQEHDFKTKSAVPNPVEDLLVYSKDTTYFAIRWKPPYPPTGNVEGYLIRWFSNFLKNTKFTTTEFQPCQLWPDFSCANLTVTVTSYIAQHTIEVAARNDEPSDYGSSNQVKATPKKEAPQPPYDLTINWSDKNDLELSWKHPNVTNGELEKFIITITTTDPAISSPNLRFIRIENYSIENTNYIYNYKFKEKLRPSVKYHVEVTSFNGYYSKKPLPFLEDTSPPPLLFLNEKPKIGSTNTTITLEMYPEKVDQTDLDARYLLVLISGQNLQTVGQHEEIDNVNVTNFKHIFKQDLTDSSGFINLTIGTNETKDIKLYPGTCYSLKVIVVNLFKNKMRREVYELETSTLGKRERDKPSVSGNSGSYALLLLLLILPIIFFTFKNKTKLMNRYNTWRQSLQNRNSNEELVMNGRNKEDEIPLANTETKETEKAKSVKITENINNISKELQKNPLHSKRIKITDFEQYVKDSIYSGELERQHKLFPRGQTKPWDYAALKVNKIKNRYNNLLAYDHTRVILERIKNDQYSDYINANYVDGYKIRKAYIATQGPKMNTLNDFWRMIWQENVEHIFMLANIYENGKKKVEKYWPDINDELQFENITVQYCSNEVFADYEYRMFNVTQNGEVRKIDQLHFTTWPDHGVPMYAQSLVPFLQKMLKIPVSSKSPAVVHCSAGVGRTGTVILCDIALRMAAREGAVDFLGILKELRDQRANLVDNVEQYKLAHLVVLECLVGMHTSIPCGELEEVVKNILMNDGIRTQMRYLNDTAWQDHAMQTIGQLACQEAIPTVAEKNRYQDTVSDSLKRIFLPRYPVNDETSSYINAVKVDGFQCPGRFITTQQPMPNTLGDFWRLAESSDVSVIISLNKIDVEDDTSCHFWPDQDNPEMKPVDYITLRFNATQSLDHYDIVTLQMHLHNEEEYTKMQIVHMKSWAPREDVPKEMEEFLTFWEESDVLCRGSSPIIVTCHDGIKASGVFVAMSFIIEKIKLEQLCDVCQATRAVRHSRRQFINEVQFMFLYEAALKYVKGFQSYSNFS